MTEPTSRQGNARYVYLAQNPTGCDDDYPAGIGYTSQARPGGVGPCMTDLEAIELSLGANLLLAINAVGPQVEGTAAELTPTGEYRDNLDRAAEQQRICELAIAKYRKVQELLAALAPDECLDASDINLDPTDNCIIGPCP